MTRQQIVLIGMPASGKSRVGRELASALGLEHRDSDALIEETTGRKISEIFSTDGEDYFRQLEEEVIRQALAYPGVLSLGGGALTRKTTRERLRNCFVVYIKAELPELLRRSQGSDRPLLAGDAQARLEELWEARKEYFPEVASLEVQTSSEPVIHVVEQILREVGEDDERDDSSQR